MTTAAGGERAPGRPAADRAADRLIGLDVARGLAILGMITAHIWLTDEEKLVDGRSSILFATIAGMSIGLMTARARAATRDRVPGARDLRRRATIMLLTRAGLLFALGVVLTVLMPPLSVILDDYAVYFLLLIPLVTAPRLLLLAVAAVLAVVGPLLVAGALGVDSQPAESVLGTLGWWLLTGSYPAAVFLVFPLLGLVCARSDLRRLRTRVGMLIGGGVLSALGYGAAALIPGVDAEAHSGSTAEILGSGGLALAIVGGLLLVCDAGHPASRAVRLVLRPVAAAGSMPLTVYTAHVLGMVIASGVALTATGSPVDYGPWLLPVMLVGALVLGSALRAVLGAGPLELTIARAVAATTSAPARA